MRKGLFTTSAMDNIDNNASDTKSTISFHGTSISLFQHLTSEKEGEQPQKLQVRGVMVMTVTEPPDFYVNIKSANFDQ